MRAYIAPLESRRKAEEAARKALPFDENLAEPPGPLHNDLLRPLNMADEIVRIVERQLNEEFATEQRCGSETLLKLGIDGTFVRQSGRAHGESG